jgi:hypothetical protein
MVLHDLHRIDKQVFLVALDLKKDDKRKQVNAPWDQVLSPGCTVFEKMIDGGRQRTVAAPFFLALALRSFCVAGKARAAYCFFCTLNSISNLADVPAIYPISPERFT